jgi:hypothetical protein
MPRVVAPIYVSPHWTRRVVLTFWGGVLVPLASFRTQLPEPHCMVGQIVWLFGGLRPSFLVDSSATPSYWDAAQGSSIASLQDGTRARVLDSVWAVPDSVPPTVFRPSVLRCLVRARLPDSRGVLGWVNAFHVRITAQGQLPGT